MVDDTIPEPLVPAEIDLAGYGFMPLHGDRLFGSDFNARCSDAEWRAGVTLWWAAWKQVPAASLPDDDVALCRLADLGRDLRGWRKLRANALHGFVRCSDGRLYHQVLAQLALEAWDRRIRDRERKAKWRAGRNADGDGDKGRDGDGDRNGTSPLKRSEVKRSEAKRSEPGGEHTPPNPPQAGGGVGVASEVDFEARLTALLDQLGVASGPDANRRWVAVARTNRSVRDEGDILKAIRHGVTRARQVIGARDQSGRSLVNHASDAREWIQGWAPKAAPGESTT